jgi:hypothetical protein
LLPDDIGREAAAIGDQVRLELEADPYQALRWDIEIGASLWTVGVTNGHYYTDITEPLSPAEENRLAQRVMCYALVDQRLAAKGSAND